MNTKKEIKGALEQLAYEMAHPTDKEGARFKIGDHVRMKHDGATGTVVRVTGPLYDGFSYEVKRDIPVEGIDPGSKIYTAFPMEDGLEAA